jgi:phosphoserine phosphatase RsbU/P
VHFGRGGLMHLTFVGKVRLFGYSLLPLKSAQSLGRCKTLTVGQSAPAVMLTGKENSARAAGNGCLRHSPARRAPLANQAVRVSSRSLANLRLHVEEPSDSEVGGPRSEVRDQADLIARLTQAFGAATGWDLRLEQSPLGFGEAWSKTIDSPEETPPRLVLGAPIDPSEKNHKARDLNEVRPLALAIGDLLGEIQQLRYAVWQREAELAAGVPVKARHDEEPHLAERLEAVLKGGAEAIGCHAAGLYLLDEATSVLKLRAAWGLPQDRLLAPPRPLRGSMADLEALVGHAVALEDTSILPHWRCPEDYPSAVCVPVSSPTMPLGTLWVFSDHEREFTPQETNLLEIIAGRLAADLEREMLLAAGGRASQSDRQLEAAARWTSERLPSITPLVDDYDLAGWTKQAGEIGGDFHDWSVHSDGRVSLIVGDAAGAELEATLTAAAVQTCVRSHATYGYSAGELLTRVNDTLVAASPGNQQASCAYALLDPASQDLQVSIAGDCLAIVVGPDGRLITTSDTPRLGQLADCPYASDPLRLAAGEVLLLVSGGVRRAIDSAGLRIGEASIASLVARHLCCSAKDLVARLQKLLDHDAQAAEDLTVLVVKRKGERRRCRARS